MVKALVLKQMDLNLKYCLSFTNRVTQCPVFSSIVVRRVLIAISEIYDRAFKQYMKSNYNSV